MARMGKQADMPGLAGEISVLAAEIVSELEPVRAEVKLNAVARVFAAYCATSDVTYEQATGLISSLLVNAGMERGN